MNLFRSLPSWQSIYEMIKSLEKYGSENRQEMLYRMICHDVVINWICVCLLGDPKSLSLGGL